MPILYDASLQPVRRLYPVNVSLTLSMKPLSTATMIVSKDEGLEIHDWIELFTPHGSAGFFRVSRLENAVNDHQIRVTLEQGLCVLRDAIADIAQTPRRYTATDIRSTETTVSFTGTEAQVTAACIAYQDSKPGYTPNWAIVAEDNGTYFEGTPTNVLQQILEYQTIRIGNTLLWQKGTVAPTAQVRIDVKHDTCLDLLDSLMEELPEYMITTDQSTFPWVVSIVPRASQVSSEGRLSRNLTRAQTSYDDGELFTRVYMDDLPNGYMDADTVSTYGIIGKYIESGDKLSLARKTQLCQRFLAKHKNPQKSITLDAMELKQLTGDDLDSVDPGKLYRLAMPDYGITLTEQVVTLYYPDVYNQPGSCNITLANDEKILINKISEIEQKASGGGGRADKIEEDADKQKIKYDLQVSKDEKHFSILATEGEWSDAWDDYMTTHKSYFGQTARKFQLIATDLEYADLEAGDTTLVRRFDGEVELTARNFSIVFTEQERQALIDGSMSLVTKMTSEFSQTAAQIALKVSKGAVATQLAIECGNVTITGGNLTVDGYVTASAFNAEQARFNNLVTGQSLASKINVTQLSAGSIAMSDSVFTPKTVTMDSTASFTVLSPNASISIGHSHWITASADSSGQVTITLGRTQSANGSANFNIADTAFYRSAVSAAASQGYTNAANAIVWPVQAYKESCYITYPNTSGGTSQKAYFITQGGWSSGKKLISLRQNSTTGTIVAQRTVELPASGTWTVESRTGVQYGIPVSASFRVGGKTYTYTGEI